MSKILFISNISNRITSFVTASITAAHSLSMDFYQVANWQGVDKKQIEDDEQEYNIRIKSVPISRNPLAKTNITAYKELVSLIRDEEIEYIHCNTPTGGVLGRLVGKKCKIEKVIYQSHGFHFYKGAPIKNWVIYYSIEKWLAHYTDAVITINREDFELAKSRLKLRKNGKVYFVPGVGIDIAKYNCRQSAREKTRTELGIGEKDCVIISVGNLNEYMNYELIIRAIAEICNSTLKYFILAYDSEIEKIEVFAKKWGIHKQIHFLSLDYDIKEVLAAADIFLYTPNQEAIPSFILEAMASGLPYMVSNICNNENLFQKNSGGFFCEISSLLDYKENLKYLVNNKKIRKSMGRNNLITMQKFCTEMLNEEIKNSFVLEILKSRKMTSIEYIQSLYEFFPTWARKRIDLGIPIDAFVLISVGELNENKNNGVIISAMEKLHNKKIHYVLCGVGKKQIKLQEQADILGLHDNVHFLGYRNDVKDLYEIADCFVLPSLREGLSRSIMEAMASGLPCIVSKIRGNIDLISNKQGGFWCDPMDSDSFAESIGLLFENSSLCEQMSLFNQQRIKEYDISVVVKAIRNIYAEV